MIACSDGVVVIVDCIAERQEHLGYTSIVWRPLAASISARRRGLWEHGPLVEADEGYGTRHDFRPIPDMPDRVHIG